MAHRTDKIIAIAQTSPHLKVKGSFAKSGKPTTEVPKRQNAPVWPSERRLGYLG